MWRPYLKYGYHHHHHTGTRYTPPHERKGLCKGYKGYKCVNRIEASSSFKVQARIICYKKGEVNTWDGKNKEKKKDGKEKGLGVGECFVSCS